MVNSKQLLADFEAFDIQYYRNTHCGTCANKQCNQNNEQVNACISDDMIQKYDNE
jgi:hypothetical protein